MSGGALAGLRGNLAASGFSGYRQTRSCGSAAATRGGVAAAAGCDGSAGDAAVSNPAEVCLDIARQGPSVLFAASRAQQRLHASLNAAPSAGAFAGTCVGQVPAFFCPAQFGRLATVPEGGLRRVSRPKRSWITTWYSPLASSGLIRIFQLCRETDEGTSTKGWSASN